MVKRLLEELSFSGLCVIAREAAARRPQGGTVSNFLSAPSHTEFAIDPTEVRARSLQCFDEGREETLYACPNAPRMAPRESFF